MPQMSSTNAAMIAAKVLTHALRNPTPAPPFATIGNTQLIALKQLTEIFQSITAQPKLTIPTTPPTPGATFVLPSPITTPPRVQNTSPNEHANNQPCIVPNDYPMTHTCQHLQQPTTTPHIIPHDAEKGAPIQACAPIQAPTPLQHMCHHLAIQQPCHRSPQISMFPNQANSVIDTITRQSYAYRHLITSTVAGHTKYIWSKSFAKSGT
jgi:hypothetical protein